MTDKQYMRMQALMLKDEVQKLTEAEHDEMFALIELAETEANEGGEINDCKRIQSNLQRTYKQPPRKTAY